MLIDINDAGRHVVGHRTDDGIHCIHTVPTHSCVVVVFDQDLVKVGMTRRARRAQALTLVSFPNVSMANTSAVAIPATAETGASFARVPIPDSFGGLVQLIVDRRQRVLQAALQVSKIARPPRPLDPHERQLVLAFFDLLDRIEMTPALREATKLDRAMELAQDTNQFRLPEPFPTLAKRLEDRWVAQNWGATNHTEPTPPSNHSSPVTPNLFRPIPHPDHPIFGVNGIMRGILIVHGQTKSYRFNPSYQRRDPNVFGHNGLEVGACWPLQIAALRDGAHGSRMGGISGTADVGAYSIVISGMYADLDSDLGDTVFYSGSQSLGNTDPHQPIESGPTLALHTSMSTRRPVRVLRGSGGKGDLAPRAGLRYDGLYRVVSTDHHLNHLNGLYTRFRLERLPDQPPIQRHLPLPATAHTFDLVRRGY